MDNLRNQYGETLDPTQPLVVASVEGQQLTSKSETITYNGKAAAGAVSVNNTAFKPIASITGGRVASFWGLEKNKVYEAKTSKETKDAFWLLSVTETNGSAAFSIFDPTLNLENAFESATGTVKRYVAKVTDIHGASLYGWIFTVAASSGVYTFDVCNNRSTETKNWVGTLASFDNTALAKVEIFSYESSLVFGTGTTATEEVLCPREYSKSKKAQIDYAARTLSNGQYVVDYMRGWVIVKKADTTASETITYNVNSTVTSSSGGGGEYNATPPTLADGATTTLQTDVNGNLKVNIVTGGGSEVEGKVAAGASGASTKPVVSGGVYKASPTAVDDGDVTQLLTDAYGRVVTYDGTLRAGEDQTLGIQVIGRKMSFSRITAAATTVVKSGAGAGGFIYVEVALTGTVTVYNNTSATGTIVAILPIGTVGAVEMPGNFTTGMTVVTSAADRLTAYIY